MVRAERTTLLILGIGVIAAGLSLRAPITSVAAILVPTADSYRLNTHDLAVLSALPVLMFAITAPLGPLLSRKLGVERTILWLLIVLAAALLARTGSSALLMIGTAVIGTCIAGISVLAPELIKRRLVRRTGLWMGLYTTSFGVGAAFGAAATVPLLQGSGSVHIALGAWVILPLLASFLAGMSHLRPIKVPVRTRRGVSLREVARQGQAWSIAMFFGLQGLIYFAVTAWLPTFYEDRGLSASASALLLSWLSLSGLATMLITPVIAVRRQSQRGLIVAISVGVAGGLAGLVLAPTSFAIVWVAVLGAAQGASFAMAMTLILVKSRSPEVTSVLSALVQGSGYALATAGPFLFGMLRSVSGSWLVPIGLLILASGAQAVVGWVAGKPTVLADPGC